MNRYEDRKSRLRAVFQDTMEMVKTDSRLIEETTSMVEETKIYLEDIGMARPDKSATGDNIFVVEDTTFSCAGKMVKEGKVAALNFANAFHPGGGVTRGALAQEECLCRSSNLYAGLTSDAMIKNYYRKNEKYAGRFGSDTVAYHPGVVVFKDDQIYANLMDQSKWFKVDVITCAAPRISYTNIISDEEQFQVHLKRGRRIIQAAAINGAEILILGAFGCGAFSNNPEMVAKAYRYLLIEEGYADFFKKVVFAIKKDHNDVRGNYDSFKKIFKSE